VTAAVGRYGETAMWVVIALIERPRTAVGLLDTVRDLNGRVGPGRLLGAVARLERLELVTPVPAPGGSPVYRLNGRLLRGGSRSTTISHSTEEPRT
jgi:hypothetical protein